MKSNDIFQKIPREKSKGLRVRPPASSTLGTGTPVGAYSPMPPRDSETLRCRPENTTPNLSMIPKTHHMQHAFRSIQNRIINVCRTLKLFFGSSTFNKIFWDGSINVISSTTDAPARVSHEYPEYRE